MRKVVAALNMTLDGFCDHTSGIADEELHQHYSELLHNGAVILYGRITYQLMEFWPTILKNPTGKKAMDEFAVEMDRIPKIVFSNTLKAVEWATASLATKSLEETVLELRQQPGSDILVGSRSLIVALLNLNLVDELQLCIQPIIAGKGLPLFENIQSRHALKLVKTKLFSASGSMTFYYSPEK
jgi:dihydrofolate reductase